LLAERAPVPIPGVKPNSDEETLRNALLSIRSGYQHLIEALEDAIRVCPGSLSGITKLSQHESDRRESEEGQRIAAEVLKIFGQATATIEPVDSPFNYPAFRKNDKSFGLI